MSKLARRSVLLAGAGLLAGRDALAEAPGGPWAVELFTSQGCSSCPPADVQLGQLARQPDIVALSFHVDYWDYIGWKDRFATGQTTARQRAYSRALNQRYVYTPEMVVEGRIHQPGINNRQVETMLADARRRSTARFTPQIARAPDGGLRIGLEAAKLEAGPADVTVFFYDRRHSTPVLRGENEGRRLDNFNIVRRFEMLGQWNGTQAHWSVPAGQLEPGQGLAVIVQQPDHGPVVGANKFEPPATG
jgi:hypothetical protein